MKAITQKEIAESFSNGNFEFTFPTYLAEEYHLECTWRKYIQG